MVTPIPERRKFDHGDLMSYAIRMIIPMKREFGVALDVQHFLHDFAYAKEVLDVALSSQDTRLRDNASYLETKLFGPRNSGGKPMAKTPPDAVTPTAPKPAEEDSTQLTEDQMRARMISKYKIGLR